MSPLTIKPDDLKRFLGYAPPARLYQGLVEIAPSEEITTPLRLCHFLAQCAHESAGLTHFHEIFDYAPADLLRVFGRHITDGQAAALGRQSGEAHVPASRQAQIANVVYAGRYGNGDEASGDGSRYRGRGAIQTTFRDNYAALNEELGHDFTAQPELLEDPYHAIRSAGLYWRLHGCNAHADADDLRGVTLCVNAAQEGLAGRAAWLAKAKAVWMPEAPA